MPGKTRFHSSTVLAALLGAGVIGLSPAAARAQGAPGPAGPAVAPSSPVDVAPGTPGYVRLHIDATRPGVELLRIRTFLDDEEVRESVCQAPCDRMVDGRGDRSFRIGMRGDVLSRAFMLDDRTGEVSIRVDWGISTRARVVGGIIGALGLAAEASGGYLLAAGNAHGDGAMVAGGASLVGAGVLPLVAALVLELVERNHVSIETPPKATLASRARVLTAGALRGAPVASF